MAHQLPALPYDFAALEPHIDAQTMQIHHGKHHQAYVNNLNAALEKHPELQSKSVEDLIRSLSSVPEDIRTAVRNNGGGHVNHTMFWKLMAPGAGGAPSGAVALSLRTRVGGAREHGVLGCHPSLAAGGSPGRELVGDRRGAQDARVATADQAGALRVRRGVHLDGQGSKRVRRSSVFPAQAVFPFRMRSTSDVVECPSRNGTITTRPPAAFTSSPPTTSAGA